MFERGDVTLYEWVPTGCEIHAIADEAQTRTLCDLFPGARLDVDHDLRSQGPSVRGAAQDAGRLPDARTHLGRRDPEIAPLRRAAPRRAGRPARLDPRPFSPGRITESNGRDSLAVACEADELVQADEASAASASVKI